MSRRNIDAIKVFDFSVLNICLFHVFCYSNRASDEALAVDTRHNLVINVFNHVWILKIFDLKSCARENLVLTDKLHLNKRVYGDKSCQVFARFDEKIKQFSLIDWDKWDSVAHCFLNFKFQFVRLSKNLKL